MIKLYCTTKEYPTCFVKCAAGYGCFWKNPHILLWPTRQQISISIFTKHLMEIILKQFCETKQDFTRRTVCFQNINIFKFKQYNKIA